MRAPSFRLFPSFPCSRFAVLAAALLLAAPILSQETLIAPDAFWRYFKGTEEPPATWNAIDFDDSLWLEGQAGFGYGDNDDNTILDDMLGMYWSVYIRTSFEVPNVNQVPVLQLGVQWDDGFVAYLNGTEIARANITGAVGSPTPFNTAATSHDVQTAPQWFTVRADGLSALRQGRNVIAIQVHNTTIDSSDLSMIPQLRSYSDVCPTTLTCIENSTGGVRLTWGVVVTPPPFEAVEVIRNGTVIGMPTLPTSRTFTDTAPLAGQNVYQVVATVRGTRCSGAGVPSCTITVGGPAEQFRRGDADRDRQINLTDPLYVLNFLFANGPTPGCPDSADADDSGLINLTDGLYLLNGLFLNGPAPPAPGTATCGPDATTTDTLGACTYTTC